MKRLHRLCIRPQLGQFVLWLLLASLLLGAASGRRRDNPVSQQKPNIILILSDDQRYNTIHALGGKQVITPHLDSLVRAGTTFTHAYNMGAWHGAVCVASRTMMLTGLSVWEAQRSEKKLADIVATSGLWAQHLRAAGYETYMTGKWHVRADVNTVFDHVAHERPGMANQTPQGYNRPLSRNDTTWTPWNKEFEGFWKGGKHWSEVLADDATGFLQQASGKSEPFFMYLAFNAPHDPRQAPKKFVDMYPVDKITLPGSYEDLYPFKEEMGAGIDLRDEQLAPFPRTPYAIKKHIQEYYASITHMDEQVGKILKALAATGKLSNTYVFFASDHGLSVGHHGLMGKQSMFDHSLRVPLVVVGPGIPKGEKRDQAAYLQDIMATTYELAGVEKPEHVYFNSLMPAIRNKKSSSPYPEIYGGYMDCQRMVRTEQYKLVVYPDAEKLLLFDVIKDPEEMRDISSDPANAKVVEDMKTRLLRQQKQLNDTLNIATVLDQYPFRKPPLKSGWEVLFDGHDLDQFRSAARNVPPPSGWIVRDGILSVMEGRTGGDIITRGTYGSFELKLDFRLTESANSGIKYLVNKIRNEESKKYSFMGIEYQVIDDANYAPVKIDPAGDISTGAVYLLYPPAKKTLLPPGEWNQLRIVVRGKHAEHWLNGEKLAEYERNSDDFKARVAKTKFKDYPDYALADTGRILIQDHGDQVSYRNIMVKRLD